MSDNSAIALIMLMFFACCAFIVYIGFLRPRP